VLLTTHPLISSYTHNGDNTLQSRVFVEKMVVSQIVNKFLTFYATYNCARYQASVAV